MTRRRSNPRTGRESVSPLAAAASIAAIVAACLLVAWALGEWLTRTTQREDRMTNGEPPLGPPPDDTQSRVFREADEDAWSEHTLLHHPHGTLADLEPEPHKTVEDYENENWDEGRVGPKTPDEAQAALAERIADPNAPDTEREAGAYDDADPDDDGSGDTFADERGGA